MKNIKSGENKHNRKRPSIIMHTKTPSVTIQVNITAMRYRNDIIQLVLFLGMMLSRDYPLCHVARSTLHVVMFVANNVQKLRWPAKSLDLNPTDHFLDLLKHKIRAQLLQLNLRYLTMLFIRYVRPFHNSISIDMFINE